MPPRRLPRILAACVALFSALGAFAPLPRAAGLDALAYLEALPASNPYREVLLRFERLPAKERETLNNWASAYPETPAPDLTPAQLDFARALAADLRAASAHPPLEADSWPKIANPDDPDNPAAISLPGVGRARDLARISARIAESQPPGEAVATYAALAQFGRQQRAGSTLIEQLTGVAIEGIALGGATKRLGDFSADDLQRLAVAWGGLAPAPSIAEAVAGERDVFFKPILENVIVPGLRSILADPDAGRASDSASPDAGFTRDLRLSALMNLGGDDLRIVLENTRTKESFTLAPGRPAAGIELLSMDFPRRLALIRRGGREALVHLESKRIVEREDAATRLRKMFGFFDRVSDEPAGEGLLSQILSRARRHPDGVDGYARDLLAAYQSGIDRQVEAADSPKAPPPGAFAPPADDPFLAMAMPTIGKVARTPNNSATFATMLQAAAHHRMEQLGEGHRLAAPADPWAADGHTPFIYESVPDGGFLLRSAYEFSPGQPLTYKFAAPDAGLVRPKSP